MAQKPDGKPAKLQRVQFTRPAAERIAKVVRKVEEGDRRAGPLKFGPRQRPVAQAGDSDIFRVAKFEGPWGVGEETTIEFINWTFTPNTATAKNLFCGISGGDEYGVVGVAKDVNNVWHLISWEMQEVCTTRIIDIEVTAILNTADCAITIGRTLVTSEMKFLRLTYPFATCSTVTTPG